MDKIIDYAVKISRIVVGSLFIVSGLIKTNDAVGFSYKLTDYFVEGVLNMEYLSPYALVIAMFICIVEVVLGVALIFGIKGRLVSWSILLMMLFFTWLTWYTASCLDDMALANKLGEAFSRNCVQDCGCFGDAVKLSPHESFRKDLFLMVFTLILFIWQKRIKFNTSSEDKALALVSLVVIFVFSGFYINWWFPVGFSAVLFLVIFLVKKAYFHKLLDWMILGITTLMTVAYTLHCYLHLPIKDFRPYKEGANIEEGMSIPPDAQKPLYEITWIINENGKNVTYVTNGNYPETTGTYVSQNTVEIDPGYEPPIHDFTIELGDQDLTSQVLQEERMIFVVAYNLDKSNEAGWKAIKIQTDAALAKGYQVIGLSASTKPEDINKVVSRFDLKFKFHFCDETALKTVVRSNPGLLKLHKGTIQQKLHHNDAEDLVL